MWSPDPVSEQRKRNRRVALICGAVFAGMVGMAFDAVPFYRAFCQATGFAGTPRRAFHPPAITVADRTVTVGFDTNVRGLDWTFEPDVPSQTVHPGASNL